MCTLCVEGGAGSGPTYLGFGWLEETMDGVKGGGDVCPVYVCECT